MYRKQVRRRRATLVLLVVACLVMISTSFSEGDDGPLHSAQNGVGSILTPLQEGADRALKPFRDLVNWFDETFDARGENEQLKEENQELRDELTKAQERYEEGLERKKITDVTAAEELASLERIDATVIGRSASAWTQTLQVDKGRRDGVSVDDAVVTGDGLVGRVASVTGGSSRVALLTDQETAVTARVLKRGPLGVVGAEVGDPDDLILELIEGGEEVDPGSELVTSGFANEEGLRSRYPAGIPIGEIRESDPGEQALQQRVHVKPFADLDRIVHVAVLGRGSGDSG
ncbi:MAG TPA: rod shape-determining protein MreC [Solirubrobacterales bacterium]|nr:rod shape-determining protein MreC [Solirubrobacterales bacterium]